MREGKNVSDKRVRNVFYDKECSVRKGCELMSNVFCLLISHTETDLGDHTVTKKGDFMGPDTKKSN
jgi:hypothetical protein